MRGLDYTTAGADDAHLNAVVRVGIGVGDSDTSMLWSGLALVLVTVIAFMMMVVLVLVFSIVGGVGTSDTTGFGVGGSVGLGVVCEQC